MPSTGLLAQLYECIAVERTLTTRPTIHAGETIGLLLTAALWTVRL
jgi:hypothetical protein